MVRRVVWAANAGLQAVCNFRLCRASNLCEHQTIAVFDLQLMVGRGEHKGVVDEGGFRVYCVDMDWGLNFVSVSAGRGHQRAGQLDGARGDGRGA